jgi:rubrerythrin
MKHWTLDAIPWETFDPSKVDPEILKVVKAASMVEYNGGDYATYLCNVFADDPDFQEDANAWAREEVQHGEALGKWAELADPTFDFKASFRRFTDGFKLPLEAQTSVRGSRSGELVARCIVETGTSSYYTALADAADEPVLKAICRNIAGDEHRHYKLFYDNLKRYLEKERIGRVRRILVGLGRVRESEDDELAYAYFAANAPADATYDRKTWSEAYLRRAYGFYKERHLRRAAAMVLKAIGVKSQGRLADVAAKLFHRFLSFRHQRLVQAGS